MLRIPVPAGAQGQPRDSTEQGFLLLTGGCEGSLPSQCTVRGPRSGLTPILLELLSTELLLFGLFLVPLCWAVQSFVCSQLVWITETLLVSP